MANSQVAEAIRNTYGDCCLTNSYTDQNCSIDISGLDRSDLATVHGDQNQSCQEHKRPNRLCDRLVFGQLDGDFLCAIELKGGKNPGVPTAIRQIQGGLELARSILQNHPLKRWYPLLFFNGKMKGNDLRTLQTRRVSYGGKKKLIDQIDCGSSLFSYLSRQ